MTARSLHSHGFGVFAPMLLKGIVEMFPLYPRSDCRCVSECIRNIAYRIVRLQYYFAVIMAYVILSRYL